MDTVSPQHMSTSLGEDAVFEGRLLQALSSAGAISPDSSERAQRAYARAGGSLVDIIIRLGLCEEKALVQAIAGVTGLNTFAGEAFPEQAIRPSQLSVPFLREARVLPLIESDDAVLLAGADPTNALTLRALTLAFGKPVRFLVATASAIEEGLVRLYGGTAPSGETAEVPSATSDITDIDVARLRESASQAPIVRFVERLIARAIDGARLGYPY